MSHEEKLVKQMKQGIRNVSFRDVEKLLDLMGYEFDRQKGSHKTYVKPGCDLITIKETKPMKEYMVKMVIRRYETENEMSGE